MSVSPSEPGRAKSRKMRATPPRRDHRTKRVQRVVCGPWTGGASRHLTPLRRTRTSTLEQVAGFEAQIAALTAAGCEKMFQEQISSLTPRRALQEALEFVRYGKSDRLAC